MLPETVRLSPVETDDRHLLVSTVKIAPGYYDTVVFDDSDDRRHRGKTVGGFVIDHSSKRDDTRDEAMNTHRALFLAARDDDIC